MERYYRNRLGGILVAAGLLSEQELEETLEQQRKTSRRLGDLLLQGERIDEEDIVEARALQMDIPHIHLGTHTVNPDVAKMVPESLARNYHLVPVSASDGRIAVAMFDPLDVEAIDMVQRATRCKADPLLASESRILALINSTYGEEPVGDISSVLEEAVDAAGDVEISKNATNEDESDLSETRRASEQAPIVRTVNHILKEAVDASASDIHIEPRKKGCEVRYRIDGALREIRMLPKSIQAAVISRIKIMGEVDIAEKRIPQDGRIAITISRRSIDIRLSTLPTQYGERVVMRLLDRGVNALSVEQLGFSPTDRANLDTIIRKPYGIILVTGPTGSGKTTSLYSFLNEVKSPDVNIITVEDPIEYDLEGVSQSNVNVKAGLTFANQLRAILRQDPDIILVGEIRDRETADIAFRASMTGHLVFSTLHCNDAAGAFARLTDMGVEPFLIASSLSGVLAQRLVRRVCPSCREEYTPDSVETNIFQEEGIGLNGAKLLRASGCKNCGQSGYKGRTLIAEVLPVTSKVRQMALEKASSDQIKVEAIKSGMQTMRHDGLRKVLEGITTFDEVRRKVFICDE